MHKYAFYASIPAALYLLFISPDARVFWPVSIYALSLLGLFGISALYHRVDWGQFYLDKIGTLDRVMIYVFIAASFTPFGFLAMTGRLPEVLMSILWGAVAVGLFVNFFWLDAPNWVHSLLYIVVGAVVIFAVPQLAAALGPWALVWMVVGGILHLIGGLIYGLRFPDPRPRIFGFHEVFHCFVTVAIATHYGVVAFYLIPMA